MFLRTVALALGLQLSPPEPVVDVAWRGSPGCVDAERFSALVLELAGPPKGAVTLSATPNSDDTWGVTVEYDGVERTVTGPDCDVLTDAAALVVAVRTDPVRAVTAVRSDAAQPAASDLRPVVAVVETEPEATAEPQPDAPEPVVRRAVPAKSAGVRRQAVPWRPTVVAGAGWSLGSLPRGGAVLRLDVGARRGALELDAGVLTTLGPRSDDAVDGVFRLFGGLGQACGVLSGGPVEIPLCGRMEVGVLQARPQGLLRPNDVNALWIAPAARASIARRTGRFSPEGFLELALPLRRHRFESDDVGLVHRLPPAVVRVGIALRWKGRS